MTARAPWIVAFAFGLLHGLGFAGALSEVGLPEGVPLALLFFNVGVEIGQLLFIATALCLSHWSGAFAFRPALGRPGGALRHRQHRHVLGARTCRCILTGGHHRSTKENAHENHRNLVLAGLMAASLIPPAWAQDVGSPRRNARTGFAEAAYSPYADRDFQRGRSSAHASAHLVFHGCGRVRRPAQPAMRIASPAASR